jgi:hypothetical protein
MLEVLLPGLLSGRDALARMAQRHLLLFLLLVLFLFLLRPSKVSIAQTEQAEDGCQSEGRAPGQICGDPSGERIEAAGVHGAALLGWWMGRMRSMRPP